VATVIRGRAPPMPETPMTSTEFLYLATRYGHIGLGVVALATFWTAGLTRKGSPVHRAAGKWYLLSMVALLVLAVPLAIRIGVHNRVAGVFLLYLEVIVTTSVWTSWRALKDKRDWAAYTGRIYRGLAWANIASGAVILAVGLFWTNRMQAIFIAFSFIGLIGGPAMLRFARTRPTEPKWWLAEHMSAMRGNGVATHIAFLSIGLPKLLPMIAGPTLQNIAWIGPLVVSVVASYFMRRKYLAPKVQAKPTLATSAGMTASRG
jgi:hypothetical protein